MNSALQTANDSSVGALQMHSKGDLRPGELHSQYCPSDFGPHGFAPARAPQCHKKQDCGIYLSFTGCPERRCVLGMEERAAVLLLFLQAVFDSHDVSVWSDEPFPSKLLLFTEGGFAAGR